METKAGLENSGVLPINLQIARPLPSTGISELITIPAGTIVPLSERYHAGALPSKKLSRHLQEMELILDKLFQVKKLSYSENGTFLRDLEKELPLVYAEFPESTPGIFAIYLFCRNLKRFDLSQFFSEMIHRWLLPWGQVEIISNKQLSFQFKELPKKPFFVAQVECHIEHENALLQIREKMPSVSQEIALGVSSALHAKHILTTKGLTYEQKITQIHKSIIELSQRKLKSFATDLLFEMHHFLLATDDEFKRLRDVKHMCRIICYQNWFRKQLRTHQRQSERPDHDRHIYFRLLKTHLRFAFGEKKVLGLIIAISHLSDYEQFDTKHILRACQRLITAVQLVPHSNFTYKNPSDRIHSFYVEIEKKDGKDFSFDELKTMQQSLENEILLSIEQLSHKLFMPHNEEEVLRNILLLSQEIRSLKDLPQIIVNFRGQSESTLTFGVILVRILKDNDTIAIEKQFQNTSDLLTFITGTKKIVGHIRNKHAKEANTFLLECPKAPFLRQDHSVDLLRAREFVISSVKKILGDVRDFNGGLICQQNQLLNSLKELLNYREMKHELHLENLFHSITPILMKSLLAPELIRSLFQLFIQLLEEANIENLELRYKELRLEQAVCLLIASEENTFLDELSKSVIDLHLKDLEIATTTFKVGSTHYLGFILVTQDQDTLLKFSSHITDKLNSYFRQKNLGQILKISLPRPTSLLDPRIGTDRTSGIVIKMLYEGLMRIDMNGSPSFAIAERVDVSPNQKRYTFHLRDTKWSNGKPVTAYDFEYAWKKILDPHFKAIYAYLLYPIRNAKAAKKGFKTVEEVGITAIDHKTLQVELENPAPYFLELVAHWVYSPLCKEIDELHPGWAYYGGEHFVCNGPFRLAKWKRNSEIQAIKNSEYWDAEFVHLRRIDISIIENAKTALEMYEKGELDCIGEPLSELPPDTFRQKAFNDKILSHPISAVHWYECNVKAAPFQSKKCRLALAKAINRQTLIDEVLQGREQAAYSILPPSLSLSSVPYFTDGNEEEARRLFEEGLKEQGLTLSGLPRFSLISFHQEIHQAIAENVTRRWKEVLGLDLKIETYKWEQFMQKCMQHDFHIMSITWYSWFNDPLYNLEHVKQQTGDMNLTQWQNEEFIQLLDQATVSLDLKQRKQLLAKAEKLVMEEMPIIPFFYYTFKYMKKEHVNNIFLSHLGQIDFKWAYINKQK